MLESRENLANQIGLFGSTMVMIKEMVVVISLKREVDFSTLYYISKHDIAEAGKKNMDRRTYLVVEDAIDDTN